MSDPVSLPSSPRPRSGPPGPGVPLSVWAAGPAGEAAAAVTAFSRPGDLVVVLAAGPGAVLESAAAAAAGRQVLGVAPGGLLDPACPHAGQAALVIAAMPRPAGREVYAACERALRPGGILAVLTPAALLPSPAGDGGQVIAAARAAGLVYAQHVIALQVPVTRGQLAAPPGTVPPPGAACARVHRDVWILVKPQGGTA